VGLLASVGLRPHRMFRRVVGRHVIARAVDLPLIRVPVLASLEVMFRSLGFSAQTTRAEIAHTMRCVAATDFETQRRNTARLAVPTLFAWAEDDALIERAVFEEHAAALPAGPRLSWPDGGHNIQKSRAVELAEALSALAKG
jgi:pimeloyl-ACP methyl ester carboxylesterase